MNTTRTGEDHPGVAKPYFIYEIRSDIDDSVYVGQTDDVERRWWFHLNHAKNPLYAAMAKHGVEHFHIRIVEEHPTREEAVKAETKRINGRIDNFQPTYNRTNRLDGKPPETFFGPTVNKPVHRVEDRCMDSSTPTVVGLTPDSVYATVIQFAARLCVSPRTVHSWLRAGMPSVCVGKSRRIIVVEADAWLRAGGAERPTQRKRTRRQP